jgi:hypothetical protein
MLVNEVFKDPRFEYIFTFTNVYIPIGSYIACNNSEVSDYYVYKIEDGWNPNIADLNQGLIAFDFSTVPNWVYGDPYQIVSSAGFVLADVTNYLPTSGLSAYLFWGPAILPVTVNNNNVYNVFSIASLPFNEMLILTIDSNTRPDLDIQYIYNMSNYPNLFEFYFRMNNVSNFPTLNLKNCSKLKTVTVQSIGNLTNIEFDNCFALENVEANFLSTITTLNLSDCTKLKTISSIFSTAITSITLPDENLIEYFVVFGTSFTSQSVDYIISKLAYNSINNGELNLRYGGENRTTASDSAVATLISKGWTVDVKPPV